MVKKKGIKKKVKEVKEILGKENSNVKIKPHHWKTLALVLGLIVVVLLVLVLSGISMTGKITGGVILEEDEASVKLIDYLNPITGGLVNLDNIKSVEDMGHLYMFVVSFQGQEIPVYITKDGKYFLQGQVVEIKSKEEMEALIAEQEAAQQTPTQEISKSNTPKVELFIMSHCPFGTQAEKGLLPVVELLGDKVDFELKFVYYAMHGEVEVYEQVKQYCIQSQQNAKFFDYMGCFLKDGNTAECLEKANIDLTRLEACEKAIDGDFAVTKNLEDESSWLSGRYPLFNVYKNDNEKYGIGGSPTLVINGAQVQSARDSISYLNTICDAFTDEARPEECETLKGQLSSETPSSGFGYDVASGNAPIGSCS